jgi:hypothetical protein
MPHANRKRILLWTVLLTGLGAGALWASARPGWVQDRLFGPAVTFPDDSWKWGTTPASDDPGVLQELDPKGILHLKDRCHAGHYIVVYQEGGSGLLSWWDGTVVLDGNRLTTDVTDSVRNSPDRRTQRTLQLNFDQLHKIWLPLEQMRRLQPWPQSNVDAPIPVEVQTSPNYLEGGGVFQSSFVACAAGQSWYGRVIHGDGGTPAEKARGILSRYLRCDSDSHGIPCR